MKKTILFLVMLLMISFTFVCTAFYNEKEEVEELTNNCNDCYLPLVMIDTDEQFTYTSTSKPFIKTNIKIIDNKDGNKIDSKPTIESLANVRYRGNSSINFDKKGYLIKFVDENNNEKKQKVMGMDKHDEWVLHGPYLDKSMMRNYLWYDISKKIMGVAPESKFCELFINGNYQGLYLMVTAPTKGNKDRMPIKKYNKYRKNYTDYIIKLDKKTNKYNELNSFSIYSYSLDSNLALSIEYPSKKILNDNLKEFITKDLSKFEKSLYSFDYDTKYGYEKYINVDSFVDYFIINEFTQNYDAGRMSTYLYKSVNGKYNMFVWDFNSANNNYKMGFDIEKFEFQNNYLFFMLLKDEKFTDRIINRYKYLRTNYLNEDYLLNEIDDIDLYLNSAIKRNEKVWGYNFNVLEPFDRNVTNHEDAVKQLKDHIVKRGRFMDEKIETIKQFSHESKIKQYNH